MPNVGVGVNVLARGRIAWFLAIFCGVALTITGAAIGAIKSWSWNGSVAGWLVGFGAAFAVVGAIFLIASYATHGRTD
jgi:vacuolar-type H+-ATPase subunit I/STV1